MFEQDKETTPVLFRVEKPRTDASYEVTAIFPTLPYDRAGKFMQCYAHVGQHGSCSLEWYKGTRPAKPAEYAALKLELESAPYGYRLEVFERITPRLQTAFRVAVLQDKSAAHP